MKKNVLVQATKDHSFVQFLIDNGTISPAQAENHPNKNLILRALGVNESIEADTYFIEDWRRRASVQRRTDQLRFRREHPPAPWQAESDRQRKSCAAD